MKHIVKNLVIALVVLICISIAFSVFFGDFAKQDSSIITLNEVVAKIKNSEVKKIAVDGSDLEITTQDDKVFSAVKEQDSSLSETLKNYGITAEQLNTTQVEIKNASDWGVWAGVLINFLPLVLFIAFFFWLNKQAQKGAGQAFSFGKSSLKMFIPSKEKISFLDVAGLEEAKQELKEIVEFLKTPKKFLDIGAKIPRGVLLMGLPGTGKTLLARAVAGEANVPFFHISGAEFVEMFVGVGAARVRDVFMTAKKASPAILFIDEIDAVGRERGAGLGGGHDEREQTLNQILVEMDGFDNNTNIIVMAATNRPDVLDSALLRPGRFDRRVVLDLPDINEREAILKIHCRNKLLAKDNNLRRIAERTPGFSGADLANLVNEGAILSARRNKKEVGQMELLESIEKVILGPERKTKTIAEIEKKIIAYHEAGHAVVAHFSEYSDPVQKVSIIARGHAGGYTLKVPLEDRRLRTKKQFLAELAVLMGGFLSEKIFLKDISTGASNDLKEASSLARKLITQWGMSDKLGPITFGKTEEMIFLGREISTEKNYSEKVATEIDGEVKKLIDDALKSAEKILKTQKTKLDLLIKTLLDKEVIEKEEFEKIMNPHT